MKKSVMITAAAVATMICSGVSAAPLTDYSAGKTAIDLTIRSSDININGSSIDPTYNKSSNLDWGITTGLGNKFALQYNEYNAKSKDTTFRNSIENAEVKTQEFNILYQLDNNLSLYTGVIKAKGSVNNSRIPIPITADDKSKMQIGLIGSTKIGDKTTAYASLGVASDITNWKIGVSQEIAPNLEFNVDYRNTKITSVKYSGINDSFDVTSKGLGYGITYKF